MMDPHKEQFVPITEDNREQAEEEKWFILNVGDDCEINGIKCKIRKITKKDIICRPIDFRQHRKVNVPTKTKNWEQPHE